MQKHKYEKHIIIMMDKEIDDKILEEDEDGEAKGNIFGDSKTNSICVRVSKPFFNELKKIAKEKGFLTRKGDGNAYKLVGQIIKEWYYSYKWKEVDNSFNIEMRLDRIITSRVSEPLREVLYIVKNLTAELEKKTGKQILGNDREFEEVALKEHEGYDEDEPPAVSEEEYSLEEIAGDIVPPLGNMRNQVIRSGEVINYDEDKEWIEGYDKYRAKISKENEEREEDYAKYTQSYVEKTTGKTLGELHGKKDEEMAREFEGKILSRKNENEPKDEWNSGRAGNRYMQRGEGETSTAHREAPANKKERAFRSGKIKWGEKGYPIIEGVGITMVLGDKVMYEDGSIFVINDNKDEKERGYWWKVGTKVADILKEEEMI